MLQIVDPRGEAEVPELDKVRARYEDVLRFDVTVDDGQAVLGGGRGVRKGIGGGGVANPSPSPTLIHSPGTRWLTGLG